MAVADFDDFHGAQSGERGAQDAGVEPADEGAVAEHNKIEATSGLIDWGSLKREWKRIACEIWENAPPITKKFYVEQPEVTKMTNEEVNKVRKSMNNIMVFCADQSQTIPKPTPEFEHAFRDHPEILKEIYKQKFVSPSPIQAQLWPIILSGYDAIAIAQTGTGKTLGFLLPAFIHLQNQQNHKENPNKPLVLIMCPTRELALQTEKEFNKYSYKNYKAVCVFGGSDRRTQINQINDGCQFIIATPGRLADFVTQKIIDLTLISFVVLDEADRMLDLGFEPQIIRILGQMRPDRQTVLTSATWPFDIQRLSGKYLSDPIKVQIGTLELNAAHSVNQNFMFIPEHAKFDTLMRMIEENRQEKIIVFVARKGVCAHLSSEIICSNINSTSIHGDMGQDSRIDALNDFKEGHSTILIATDVASRGIDVPDVTLVINYDMPKNVEDYVHRIGRTGRAGKKGKSITFFTRPDSRLAGPLINILKEANQEIPERLYEYKENNVSFERERGGRFGGGFSRGPKPKRQEYGVDVDDAPAPGYDNGFGDNFGGGGFSSHNEGGFQQRDQDSRPPRNPQSSYQKNSDSQPRNNFSNDSNNFRQPRENRDNSWRNERSAQNGNNGFDSNRQSNHSQNNFRRDDDRQNNYQSRQNDFGNRQQSGGYSQREPRQNNYEQRGNFNQRQNSFGSSRQNHQNRDNSGWGGNQDNNNEQRNNSGSKQFNFTNPQRTAAPKQQPNDNQAGGGGDWW